MFDRRKLLKMLGLGGLFGLSTVKADTTQLEKGKFRFSYNGLDVNYPTTYLESCGNYLRLRIDGVLKTDKDISTVRHILCALHKKITYRLGGKDILQCSDQEWTIYPENTGIMVAGDGLVNVRILYSIWMIPPLSQRK